jgi:hypothetical protein
MATVVAGGEPGRSTGVAAAHVGEGGTRHSGAGVDHGSAADRLAQLGVGMTREEASDARGHDAGRLEAAERDHDSLVALLRDR